MFLSAAALAHPSGLVSYTSVFAFIFLFVPYSDTHALAYCELHFYPFDFY